MVTKKNSKKQESLDPSPHITSTEKEQANDFAEEVIKPIVPSLEIAKMAEEKEAQDKLSAEQQKQVDEYNDIMRSAMYSYKEALSLTYAQVIFGDVPKKEGSN